MDWFWIQIISCVVAFIISAILLIYLRKISTLMKIGIIILVIIYPIVCDNWYSSSGQTPILAPPPEQFVEACQMFSDAFGQSDYNLFFYTDIYMIGLNNSSILNLTA